jgi:hypothetical protein
MDRSHGPRVQVCYSMFFWVYPVTCCIHPLHVLFSHSYTFFSIRVVPMSFCFCACVNYVSAVPLLSDFVQSAHCRRPARFQGMNNLF